MYPFDLPWELGGKSLVPDPEMSDIYGHIMFAGAGLCLIICCVMICCLVRSKGGDDEDGVGAGAVPMSTGGSGSGGASKKSSLLKKGALGFPQLVEDLIVYLEDAIDTPGLFRESGKAELVDSILDGYEANKPVDLSGVSDVHAVAVALKTYYKKRLPQPFLDVEFAGDYLRHKDLRPVAARIEAQSNVINRMPPAKKLELKHLLGFLHRVAQRKSKNKMDARNLAIVFGPALFQSAFIVEATDVVVLLIQDYEPLFEGTPADSSGADEASGGSAGSGDDQVYLGKVRALYDYEPAGNNPGEMRLEEGEVILLIEDVDSNGWAQGSVAGRVGWFPMSYCERISSEDSEGDYSNDSYSDSEEDDDDEESGEESGDQESGSGSGSGSGSYSDSATPTESSESESPSPEPVKSKKKKKKSGK